MWKKGKQIKKKWKHTIKLKGNKQLSIINSVITLTFQWSQTHTLAIGINNQSNHMISLHVNHSIYGDKLFPKFIVTILWLVDWKIIFGGAFILN